MATVRRPGAIKDHNHQNSSRRDRRTSGEATVLGEPTGSIAVRRRIGFLGGDKRLYSYMTVREIIAFTRPLFRLGASPQKPVRAAKSAKRLK